MTGATPPALSASAPQGKLARRMALILVPAILVPLILAGLFAMHRAQQELRAEMLQQIDHVEADARQNINTQLFTRSARLDSISRQPPFREAMHLLLTSSHASAAFRQAQKEVITQLKGLNARQTHLLFHHFFVVGPDNGILASTDASWVGLQLKNTSLQDPLARIRARDPDYTPDPFGGIHFLFARPLIEKQPHPRLFTVYTYTDSQSNQQALVIGIADEIAVYRFLQDLAIRYPQSQAFILLPDGTYLSIDPISQQVSAYTPPPILRAKADWKTLQAEYTSPLSQRPVFALAEWAPYLHASLGLEVPRAVLYRRTRQFLPFGIAVLTVTALLLALIVWLGVRHLTQPIVEITDAARRFAAGDWQWRAPVRRDDEIGQLAAAFNTMADELSTFYKSLEEQVEERTTQIRTAAEVAALAGSATEVEEILRRTVNLITERFSRYYQASIFLIDDRGDAVLAEAAGAAGEEMKRHGHRLKVGGQSLVGWAAAHRQPRVASDVTEDPVHFKNPLLPDTRSEAAFPLLVGEQVVGVLDVQSKFPDAFDEQSLATLQTLAGQLAAAIYNAKLRQEAESGWGETRILYQISSQLVHAQSQDDLIAIGREASESLPFITGMFVIDRDEQTFHLMHAHHPQKGHLHPSVRALHLSPDELKAFFPNQAPLVMNNLAQTSAPAPLRAAAEALGCASAAYLPLFNDEDLLSVFFLGAEQPDAFTLGRLRPYTTLAEIASAVINRVFTLEIAQKRLDELQTLIRLGESIASASSTEAFYHTLHEEIQRIFGDISLLVALYDPVRRMLEIPYAYEQGRETLLNLEPVPLGEGLISRVLQERKTLLLHGNVADQAKFLGGRQIGKEAKWWLGVPLSSHDQIIGVLVLQDTEHSRTFSPEEITFVEAITNTTALLLDKLRLVERAERARRREHALFTIQSQAQQNPNLQHLLQATLNSLSEVFSLQHGAIRLQFNPEDKTPPSSGGTAA